MFLKGDKERGEIEKERFPVLSLILSISLVCCLYVRWEGFWSTSHEETIWLLWHDTCDLVLSVLCFVEGNLSCAADRGMGHYLIAVKLSQK